MILFRPVETPENPSFIEFEAIENDSKCGMCRLEIEGNKAVVYELSYDADKPYLVEGLIRSAFNFAALKSCYMGYCRCENIEPFLDRMNFLKENGIYFNDIPSILQGNCCKCKDNI